MFVEYLEIIIHRTSPVGSVAIKINSQFPKQQNPRHQLAGVFVWVSEARLGLFSVNKKAPGEGG